MEPNRLAKPLRAAALPDFVLRQFDHGSTQHDHRQLYLILQGGIRGAVLAAGVKLPPTRVLAQALGIARNTVVHVYEQLELEGYVRAGVGRGTYVSAGEPSPFGQAVGGARGAARPARRTAVSARGARRIGEAGAAPRQWGAFVPGVPEVRLFPTQIWNRIHAKVWRSATPEQLSYATEAGHGPLREAVAGYLRSTRGVVCTAEQVLITSGTQQSLHLLAQLLADPGDTAWVEDPGYWGARSVFHINGVELVPVPVDGEGLAPTPEHLARPPRLMFVSPSHQYPTGAVMSHGRRRELLAYAAAHAVWVIEDDYDSEFRYGARPLPALQGLDEKGDRVIYLGTFSKTLFPGLRLAYMVPPTDLVDSFRVALIELFREGHGMNQAVLARFIEDGHYLSHIRRMRAIYNARHDALIDAVRSQFGQALPIVGGDAGLHFVLGLPRAVDDHAVVRDALHAGVASRPLSMYFMNRPEPGKGLLLGYGAVTEEEVAPKFKLLARVLRRHL
jgi:GntR family transcriptional regulator / MocR family aminotransferase